MNRTAPIRKTLLAALLLLACAQAARAQDSFPWEEYKSRTLAELIKRNGPDTLGVDRAVNEKLTILFSGDPQYSQVRVVYTGATRKLSPARKAHLEEWGQSLGVEPKVLALFDTEMLVTECSNEHWVAVQKQVLPHFEKELKKGDMVTLFLMFAGARKMEGNWNWFFLVNEFQAYK